MLTDILSIALNAMKINKKFRILLTNTFQGYSIKLVMYRKGINRADTMMPCMQVCRVWQEWRISMENNMIQETSCEDSTNRRKERSEKEHRDMVNRLSRIEGQIRGIKGMVEKNAYCTDMLIQVAAVNAALNSFNRVLLADHITTCVTQDILDGKEETVDELVDTLKKLMK